MNKNIYNIFLSLFDTILAISEVSEWGVKDLSSPLCTNEEKIKLLKLYHHMISKIESITNDNSDLKSTAFTEFLKSVQIDNNSPLFKDIDRLTKESSNALNNLSQKIEELSYLIDQKTRQS